MFDVELIDLFVHLAGDERDEQSERIAVTTLRIAGQIAPENVREAVNVLVSESHYGHSRVLSEIKRELSH